PGCGKDLSFQLVRPAEPSEPYRAAGPRRGKIPGALRGFRARLRQVGRAPCPEARMTEMSPAEALFFAALERPPADRPAFLDQACAGDAGLRARIEQMLAAQSQLGGFLDPPQADAE